MQIRERFKTGSAVRFVPVHAFGDTNHPDCKDGIVSTIVDTGVYVRFGGKNASELCEFDEVTEI